jgi:hypothetical protein
MYGDCLSCQMKIPSTEIPKLYPNIDLDEDVSWMKWAKLNGKLDIHRISGSVHDLLLEMDHQWLKFITHSYITNTQLEYIKQLKESLPVDTVLVNMDFAENYVSISRILKSKYLISPISTEFLSIRSLYLI